METADSILLVEEDAVTRAFLADNLIADGYEVEVADSKAAAVAQLEARRSDLVICDVNGDTLDLVDAVRGSDGLASRIDPDVPLIALTTRADELARVRYLDRGCDDVVAKPFSYTELRARIRALLRRTHARPRRRVLRVGELAIDTHNRDVRVSGAHVKLAAREYALLVHLAGEPERVFTKAELLRALWGFRSVGTTRTLDSHACRLRLKLAAASPSTTRWVEAVWGVGYRLAPIGAREPDPLGA
jgi:DNA-binding response OmpR family regulator